MTRIASLHGGRRTQLRLPLSPLKAEMALKALEEWRQPDGEGREQGWYRIANQAGAPTQVNIYDEISWWGISAQEFVDDLAKIDGPVEVHINSPGGDAFDGITIYNALAARDGVTTVVDGLAASAASVIFMAGATRVASPGSMVMIHDALALCIGNAADMRETAALLDKVSDNIASVYAAHTSTPAAGWRKAMVAEGWYTAQEAVDAGLAHQLAERAGAGSEPGTAPEASFDRSVFAGWLGRPAQPHSPMTGAHSHPHPAYGSQGSDASHDHDHDGDAGHDHGHGDGAQDQAGRHVRDGDGDGDDGMHGDHERWDPDGDGDCDACPEGDTDHDYWSPDGEQLQPVPGKPMPAGRAPGPISNSEADESAWDGDAAMSWAAGQDDPAAAYQAICAGEKTSGEPDQKQHWALPHHKHAGDPPNRKGVSSALGYMDRTQDLEDKAAAQAHLDAHQKAMGGSDDGASDLAHIDLSGVDLGELANALKEAIK